MQVELEFDSMEGPGALPQSHLLRPDSSKQEHKRETGERTPLTDTTGDSDLWLEEGHLLKQPDAEMNDIHPPHCFRDDDGILRVSDRDSIRSVHRPISGRESLGPREEQEQPALKPLSSMRMKKHFSSVALAPEMDMTGTEEETLTPTPLRQQEARFIGSQQPGAFAMRSGVQQQRRTRDNTDVSVLTSQDHNSSHAIDDAQPPNGSRRRLLFSTMTPSTLTQETAIVATVVRNNSHPPTTIYEHNGVPEPIPLHVLLCDRRVCLIISFLLLIVVGLAGGLLYVVGPRGVGEGASELPQGGVIVTTPSPTSAPVGSATAGPIPSSAPTETSSAPSVAPTSAHQEIYDVLVANSFDDGYSLANETTPQSQAAQLLLSDPLVQNYSVNRLLQRYAMGTFYYIVEMFSDWQGVNSTNECSWIGVLCNPSGEVIKIELRWSGLAGYLPDELALLSALSKIVWFNRAQREKLSHIIRQRISNWTGTNLPGSFQQALST